MRGDQFDRHPNEHEKAQAEEAGQGLAEYGLILGMVAAVVIGALATFGSQLSELIGWQLFEML